MTSVLSLRSVSTINSEPRSKTSLARSDPGGIGDKADDSKSEIELTLQNAPDIDFYKVEEKQNAKGFNPESQRRRSMLSELNMDFESLEAGKGGAGDEQEHVHDSFDDKNLLGNQEHLEDEEIKTLQAEPETTFVPDPNRPRPEKYIPKLSLPWDLQLNPFGFLFKDRKVPISPIPEWILFLFLLFNIFLCSLYLETGFAGLGYSRSLKSLHIKDNNLPETSEGYKRFSSENCKTILFDYANEWSREVGGKDLIVISLLLIFNSLLAAISVHYGHRKLLMLFIGLSILILLGEWVATFQTRGSAHLCRSQPEIRTCMKELLMSYYDHRIQHHRWGPERYIDDLQFSLDCCGVDGPEDYKTIPTRPTDMADHELPMSCCTKIWNNNIFCGEMSKPDSRDYKTKIEIRGCYDRLINHCEGTVFAFSFLYIFAALHGFCTVVEILAVLFIFGLLRTLFNMGNRLELAVRSLVFSHNTRKKRTIFEDIESDMEEGGGIGLIDLGPGVKIPDKVKSFIDDLRRELGIGREKLGLALEAEIVHDQVVEEIEKEEAAAAAYQPPPPPEPKGYKLRPQGKVPKRAKYLLNEIALSHVTEVVYPNLLGKALPVKEDLINYQKVKYNADRLKELEDSKPKDEWEWLVKKRDLPEEFDDPQKNLEKRTSLDRRLSQEQEDVRGELKKMEQILRRKSLKGKLRPPDEDDSDEEANMLTNQQIIRRSLQRSSQEAEEADNQLRNLRKSTLETVYKMPDQDKPDWVLNVKKIDKTD